MNDKVEVKCNVCGKPYMVANSTYKKRHNHVWKCIDCRTQEQKNRYANLSDEERKLRSDKIKQSLANMDDTAKKNKAKKTSEAVKKYMANISKEEKELRYTKSSKAHIDNWNNTSQDERIKRGNNIKQGIANMSSVAKTNRSKNSSEAVKLYWDNISDDDRLKRSEKLSAANIRRYNSMTDDEKKTLFKKISDGQRSMSEESKLAANRKRSESLKRYIASLSIDERSTRRDLVKMWWDNISKEEYEEWNRKRALKHKEYLDQLGSLPNKNESNFIGILKASVTDQYTYRYYNKIKHPEFDMVFPMNPITGSKFINPYHEWDFKISLRNGDVLVDVDGSIHDPNSAKYQVAVGNKSFMVRDYIDFNDSKRPYQTDGLNAYIIKCYDDNLNDNTPVENIKTGNIIPLNAFISYLCLMDLSRKELCNLITP